MIEDHDTGEERQVMFTEAGGLHAWFSKSKSKDGKKGVGTTWLLEPVRVKARKKEFLSVYLFSESCSRIT